MHGLLVELAIDRDRADEDQRWSKSLAAMRSSCHSPQAVVDIIEQAGASLAS